MNREYRDEGRGFVYLKRLNPSLPHTDDDEPEPPEYEVQNVWTAPQVRWTGVQRKLWQAVLADADREGATLLLTVGHGSTAGLDSTALFEWYERLGFHGLAGGINGTYREARMERPPHGH